MHVTASDLYSFIQCPHRVWRDTNGPQEEKEKITNPFVQLLWDRGVSHEEDIVKKLGLFTNLSKGSLEERIENTKRSIIKNEKLLYQPVLLWENLLGIPDILELTDHGYIAIDIKSGKGMEGVDNDDEDGKPKRHYAIQLCLYTDLLEKYCISSGKKGIIWDINGNKVEYELEGHWSDYENIKNEVWNLKNNSHRNKPAMVGVCKLCPWYHSCNKWCTDNQDLSLIYRLGRSARDTINGDVEIFTVPEMSMVDIESVMEKKKKKLIKLNRVGESTLIKYRHRAEIQTKIKHPIITQPFTLPTRSYELYFDIEDDPTQDFVYLHGVLEVSSGGERFIPFIATSFSERSEKQAWQNFWAYIRSLPVGDFAVYYYSHHEKSTYRRLRLKYPDVISEEELEGFFSDEISKDLYRIIDSSTEWPLGSYSLKEIAKYLGFVWEDKTPSGALSIEWYNRYLETKDEKLMERIKIYNKDDCKASKVIKDYLEKIQTAE